MRAYTRLWTTALVLLTALGILEALVATQTDVVLTSGALAGLLVGLSCYGIDHARHDRPPRSLLRPGARATGAAVAVAWVAFAGLRALLDDAAFPLVCVLLVTCPALVRIGVGVAGRSRAPGTPLPAAPGLRSAPSRPDPAAAEAGGVAVDRLSDHELCWGWRASFLAFDRLGPAGPRPQLLRLVALRQQYLDELERRDPVGFHRWLYQGARPASNPGRYINQVPPAAALVPRRPRPGPRS